MKTLVDKLREEHSLTAEEYRDLLACTDTETLEYLRLQAQMVALSRFGNKVYLRGLIEIGNVCKNNCFYCGIRKSNVRLKRYRLNRDNILECCREGYELGYRTFVLQGGEDPGMSDEKLIDVVNAMRKEFPDCAITLSLGERSRETYEKLFQEGANRYLLRHETFNPKHYQYLHPRVMSRENRLRCLNDLKEIGFQTGTGIMVGSPLQTLDHLVEDLQFFEQLKPEMIGIGPFIPHKETPFACCPAGDFDLTLKLVSILRLMSPTALIPATTAMATVSPGGRERAVLAGANVAMPSLTPCKHQKKYKIYNNKPFEGVNPFDSYDMIMRRMEAIGYAVSGERGDYVND